MTEYLISICLSSKILRFLQHHMPQMMKKGKEPNTCCDINQCLKHANSEICFQSSSISNTLRTEFQIFVAIGQFKKRWSTTLEFCLHNIQILGPMKPLQAIIPGEYFIIQGQASETFELQRENPFPRFVILGVFLCRISWDGNGFVNVVGRNLVLMSFSNPSHLILIWHKNTCSLNLSNIEIPLFVVQVLKEQDR